MTATITKITMQTARRLLFFIDSNNKMILIQDGTNLSHPMLQVAIVAIIIIISIQMTLKMHF